MTIKGMIFDLDGTLVDTLDDLTDAMNFALQSLSFPVQPPDACRAMIGNGLRKFAQRALGDKHLEATDRLLEAMVSHYQDNCLNKTRPYVNMIDVVAALKDKGVSLAVLTNKNQAPAEIIVEHVFGKGTFEPVVGNQPGRKIKPDPEEVFNILNQWGLDRSEVIFIGDSEVDVQTAQAAGIEAVGVSWGFRSVAQLHQAGAVRIVDHPDRIAEWV